MQTQALRTVAARSKTPESVISNRKLSKVESFAVQVEDCLLKPFLEQNLRLCTVTLCKKTATAPSEAQNSTSAARQECREAGVHVKRARLAGVARTARRVKTACNGKNDLDFSLL